MKEKYTKQLNKLSSVLWSNQYELLVDARGMNNEPIFKYSLTLIPTKRFKIIQLLENETKYRVACVEGAFDFLFDIDIKTFHRNFKELENKEN